MSAKLEKNGFAAFAGGAVIGTLGGLIGLGGAEFRLPLLISLFRFVALEAIILNKAMSLVVVASALPFRTRTVPFAAIADHWSVIVNLLVGSLIGAWFGASWAIRLRSEALYRIIALLLVAVAAVLVFGHDPSSSSHPLFGGITRVVIGVVAGFAIGVVAALLGVAGGELLIPTLIVLFGADVKLAGSLSLAVSLPTMIVGFTRYSQDSSFAMLGRNWAFVLIMAAGSIIGSFIGGQLLGDCTKRDAASDFGRDTRSFCNQGLAAQIEAVCIISRNASCFYSSRSFNSLIISSRNSAVTSSNGSTVSAISSRNTTA